MIAYSSMHGSNGWTTSRMLWIANYKRNTTQTAVKLYYRGWMQLSHQKQFQLDQDIRTFKLCEMAWRLMSGETILHGRNLTDIICRSLVVNVLVDACYRFALTIALHLLVRNCLDLLFLFNQVLSAILCLRYCLLYCHEKKCI